MGKLCCPKRPVLRHFAPKSPLWASFPVWFQTFEICFTTGLFGLKTGADDDIAEFTQEDGPFDGSLNQY